MTSGMVKFIITIITINHYFITNEISNKW